MKKFLLALLIGLLLIPNISIADGGMFPPDDYYIYETGQKGAIYFEDDQETLVLSTSYEGDAKDFSWIVPTPSQPEVTKVSKDIFTNLSKLTTEDTVYKMEMPMMAAEGDMGLGGVDVLEEKQLGYYDITILKADDKNALYDWFNENGYKYPKEGKYILDDYIRLGWTFTAIKITDDAVDSESIGNDLSYGNIAPLQFVFSTDKIVYPMKISSIGQYDEKYAEYEASLEAPVTDDTYVSVPYYPTGMSIELYILADHKKEITDFTTEYANWIKPNEINKLATDEEGNNWVNAKDKMYLTKMYRYMDLSEMDEDLYPQDADDNKLVGALNWWEDMLINMKANILWFLVLLLLAFFIPILWQFKKVSPACRITSWIVQILAFAVKVVLVFTITSQVSEMMTEIFVNGSTWIVYPSSLVWYYFSCVLLFTYGLPVGMLIFMIIEYIYQRNHKLNSK